MQVSSESMAEHLTVLCISTSYPTHEESVSGIFVHKLYSALSVDWRIQVVCPDDAHPGRLKMKQGVEVFSVRYAPRKWQTLGASGGIIPSVRSAPAKLLLLPGLLLGMFATTLMRARAADVLHANWAICGAIAGGVGALCRIPVVTTLRGDDVARAEVSLIDRVLLRCTVALSRKIICVSRPMAEKLIQSYPSRKHDIEFCPNGVDEAFFNVAQLPVQCDKLQVISVGSLIPRKGYDVLIKAVAQMIGKQSVRIRVVGNGPIRDELIMLCRALGVEQQFEFLGELNQDTLRKIFAESDIFVLSSRSEGRPNAVLEAVAAGLPVMCSDLDGVRELVLDGVNGWKFAIDDVHALAMLIENALAEKATLAEFGKRGRELLGSGSTWTATAVQYTNIFQAVLIEDSETSQP